MLTSLSVDDILLPKYMNWSNFRGLLIDEEMAPSWHNSNKYLNFSATLNKIDNTQNNKCKSYGGRL